MKGYTLIEMIIVVAIIAILAAFAAPAASSYIDNSNITKTQGSLRAAIGHAKAAALRNPAGAINDEVSAALCVTLNGDNEATSFQVRKATRSNLGVVNEASCGAGTTSPIIWQVELPTDVKLETVEPLGTTPEVISCFVFNNKAAVESAADCYSNSKISVNMKSNDKAYQNEFI